jgi:DNA-binding CsgD family transcriptional regulator
MGGKLPLLCAQARLLVRQAPSFAAKARLQENWGSVFTLGGRIERVASIVSNEDEFPGKQAVDLTRLSDSERRVLRLLAEGHTAKSIANRIGSTAAAVNERLREARRKTGVGSSRELARLLRAQENRDEQIGVAKASPPIASTLKRDAEPRRLKKGVIAMVALLGIAAAATFMVAQPQVPVSAAQTITDPDLGTFTPVGTAWLYQGIRQEPQDSTWAAGAERTLRDRYDTVLFFGSKPRTLRVMCRRVTCEVAASIDNVKPKSSYGPEERSIVADMRKKGLVETGANITGDASSDRLIYLAYYIRTKG